MNQFEQCQFDEFVAVHNSECHNFGSFKGDSKAFLALYVKFFEACLKNGNVPAPRLIHMFPDIRRRLVSSGGERFLFFKTSILSRDTISKGSVHGKDAFIRLLKGIEVVERILPVNVGEITEHGLVVYILDLYI